MKNRGRYWEKAAKNKNYQFAWPVMGIFKCSGYGTSYLTDDYHVKHLFCLPFTEQEKSGDLYMKFASSVITDAKGYLGNLSHYLPPGATLSELNRVAEEVSKNIQRAGLHRDRLCSILEAGMPENIEEACSMIQRYNVLWFYCPKQEMPRV